MAEQTLKETLKFALNIALQKSGEAMDCNYTRFEARFNDVRLGLLVVNSDEEIEKVLLFGLKDFI